MSSTFSIVMLGATGAVGNHAALRLAQAGQTGVVKQLSLLGRRPAENVVGECVVQHAVDIFSAASYADKLPGHDIAVCTLGVGEPSKMSREEFVKIDKDAVLLFATACKQAGVKHFILLSSVGVSSQSSSYYLRTKGELEDSLKALQFERLSLFHPSMIMTPTNRYGLSQAIALKLMPWIDYLLHGSLKQFRSIEVSQLGAAIAKHALSSAPVSSMPVVETLSWVDFQTLNKSVLS